jgi:catechol 2,3-dioxygenase-like lactoylglutathione lyase family enzyme
MVFDHLGFNVTDYAKGKEFFLQALKPLGMAITLEGDGWVMIGRPGEGDLWVGSLGNSPGPIHVAFSAANREQVRQFYSAAIAAGGQDNGSPRIREEYHPNYYAAYVIGPDGHNIEAVCHKPEA